MEPLTALCPSSKSALQELVAALLLDESDTSKVVDLTVAEVPTHAQVVDLAVAEAVPHDIENVAARTDRPPMLDRHDDVEEDVVVVEDT